MFVIRPQALLAATLCVFLWISAGCRMGFDPSNRCFLGEDCSTSTDSTSDIVPADTPEETTDVQGDTTELIEEDGESVSTCPNETDCDEDNVADDTDNCPNLWNPSQLNWDSDALGDECDPCPFVDQDLTGGLCPGASLAPACDLKGTWIGQEVRFLLNGADPTSMVTSSEHWVFDDQGNWQHTEMGSQGTYTCPSPGILWLQSEDETIEPLILTVDPRQEVAAGHSINPTGRVESGNWSAFVRAGKAPASAEDTLVVAESAGKPGSDTVANWKVVGVGGTDVGTAPIIDISGTLTVLSPVIDSPDPRGSVQGALSLYWPTGGPEPLALQLKEHPDLGTSTFTERADGQVVLTLWVTNVLKPDTFIQLEMTGQTNLSRDIVVLTGFIPALEVSYTVRMMLVRQGPPPTALSPQTSIVLTGSGPSASIRGLLPQGATIDAPAGLVVHPSDAATPISGRQPSISAVSLTQDGQVVIVPTEGAAYPLGTTQELAGHRVCMDWVPSGALALTTVCNGDVPETPCLPAHHCTLRLGLAFPSPPTAANFANDYDLDGVGSAQLDGCTEVGNPNKSTLWDTCPCLLTPGNPDLCEAN